MDKKNEARHSSLLETKSYSTSKNSVWLGYTPYEDDNTTYNGYLDQVQIHKTKHSQILIGFTIDKSNKEQLLVNDLLFIMPAIATWASRPAINRPDIKGMVTMAESDIPLLEDTMLHTKALAIKDILDANPTITDPLYVPLPRKTAFYLNITNFAAVIQMPEQMIDERAAATAAMQENIRLAMKFRKDTFLTTTKHFRELNPTFFSEWKQTMKIDGNPSTKLSFIGNIKKQAGGDPIANVTCYIPDLDKKVKSGEKGNFIFKSLPAGEYTVIFTKYGFEPVTKTVAINTGERTEVEIKMTEKIFPQ
jgi:hypothetical protein